MNGLRTSGRRPSSPLAPREGCVCASWRSIPLPLSSRGARGLLGITLAIALFSGCAQRSQLAKLAAEKEQLVAAIESEKKLNADLAARLQTSSERAAQAERELAQLDGGKSGRSSAALASTPARSSSAPASLEQFCRSQPLLKYDSRQRVARVDLNVTFDEQDRPTMDARRALHQVADLLVSANAARYSIAVSGIKDAASDDQRAQRRAQAVAQWLQTRGVSEGRVSVDTRDSASLLDEEGRKVKSPGLVALEIKELPGDAIATDPKGDGWKASGRR